MSLLAQRWAGLGRTAQGNRESGLDAKKWLNPSPRHYQLRTRLSRKSHMPVIKADGSTNGASNPSVRLNESGMVSFQMPF